MPHKNQLTNVWYEQADTSTHKYLHVISYMLQYIDILSVLIILIWSLIN